MFIEDNYLKADCPIKFGFLKEDIYLPEIRISNGELVTRRELQQALSFLIDQCLCYKKGTKFVCFLDMVDDKEEESWYVEGDYFNCYDKMWALKNLENIGDIVNENLGSMW
jgi:hypothetical protein